MSRTRRAGEALLPRGPSASAVRRAGVAGTARWRKCGPAAERRANGVAYSADNRASDARRRLLEVLPRGLRRLWDGAPCPVTLAQFPARQYLAGKIRFFDPALYYNYPLFTRVGAPFGSTTALLSVLASIRAHGSVLVVLDLFFGESGLLENDQRYPQSRHTPHCGSEKTDTEKGTRARKRKRRAQGGLGQWSTLR